MLKVFSLLSSDLCTGKAFTTLKTEALSITVQSFLTPVYPLPQATTGLLSVSETYSEFLKCYDISEIMQCICFYRAAFTQHNYFEIYPCCHIQSIILLFLLLSRAPLYGHTTWLFRLFPPQSHRVTIMSMHTYVSLYMGLCSDFPWVDTWDCSDWVTWWRCV